MSNIVRKPWGVYDDIHRTNSVVFKAITVSPGSRLSYQFHEHREEFWHCVSGYGLVIINDMEYKISPGSTFHIKIKDKHRLVNNGTANLVIYEMQCGFCSEDDIVRIEDDYRRETKS